MRLVFDENLSRKLAARLADLFPGSRHVASEGLLESSDRDIWEHAKAQGFTIVAADGDFYELAITFGPPPKVVWLRGCDYPTRAAEGLIRKQAIRVAEFLNSDDQGILILTP